MWDMMADSADLFAQRVPPKITADVLRLSAWHICTLKHCFGFEPASTSGSERDKSNHLSNLRIPLNLSQTWTKDGKFTQEQSDLIENSLNHPNLPSDVGHRDLKYYAAFLKRVREKDPTNAYALLDRNQSLKRAHVAFCNSMVHTHRQVYSTEDLLLPTFEARTSKRNLNPFRNRKTGLRRSHAGY